jgi:thiamine pyrophosphate-dependent acetolactate synthase large subunit-like protein
MAAAEDGEGSSAQFQKPRLNPEQVREAKEMLQSAKRPVMLI